MTSYNGFQISTTNHLLKQQKYLIYVILDGSISAIYLPRLRQEFYGLKQDESIFYERLVKEEVHELGHAFGLNHCENIKCIMHFSNSLSDTDIKTSRLCNVCKGHLE